MTRQFKRTDRVAQTIVRELALILQHEDIDPRLPAFVTLSGAKVSRDLSYAKIYFTALNADHTQTALILNTAAGYLRSLLAKRMLLRKVPELTFVYDESIEYGIRLSRLIDKVNPKDDEDDTSH